MMYSLCITLVSSLHDIVLFKHSLLFQFAESFATGKRPSTSTGAEPSTMAASQSALSTASAGREDEALTTAEPTGALMDEPIARKLFASCTGTHRGLMNADDFVNAVQGIYIYKHV